VRSNRGTLKPRSTGGKARWVQSSRSQIRQLTPIRTAGHCYGCTAGQGSSCGGALAEEAAHASGNPAGAASPAQAGASFPVAAAGVA